MIPAGNGFMERILGCSQNFHSVWKTSLENEQRQRETWQPEPPCRGNWPVRTLLLASQDIGYCHRVSAPGMPSSPFLFLVARDPNSKSVTDAPGWPTLGHMLLPE